MYKLDLEKAEEPELKLPTGEGNGNLLQCSCLENPRDGRAWWAAIYGVTQSQTRLKWLSSSSSSSSRSSFLLPTPVFLVFPCDSAGKEPTYNVGDLGLIPWLGRSPGEREGYPLPYSGLDNSMDCIVHGVAKSQTRLRHRLSCSLSVHSLAFLIKS